MEFQLQVGINSRSQSSTSELPWTIINMLVTGYITFYVLTAVASLSFLGAIPFFSLIKASKFLNSFCCTIYFFKFGFPWVLSILLSKLQMPFFGQVLHTLSSSHPPRASLHAMSQLIPGILSDKVKFPNTNQFIHPLPLPSFGCTMGVSYILLNQCEFLTGSIKMS